MLNKERIQELYNWGLYTKQIVYDLVFLPVKIITPLDYTDITGDEWPKERPTD